VILKLLDFLRAKGLAAAAKKASRVAAEGLIGAVVEGNVGALLKLTVRQTSLLKMLTFKSFVKNF
jgi:elongation factor Ts